MTAQTVPLTLPPPASPHEAAVRAALEDPKVRARVTAQVRAKQVIQYADGDDIEQDVFLRMLQNANKYDPEKGTVGGWMCGFAANVMLENARKAGRRPHQQADNPAALAEMLEAGDCSTDDADDARREVEQIFDRLEPDEKKLVRLKYFDELPGAAIAAELGITHDNVRQRLSRLRVRIQSFKKGGQS